MIKRVIKGILMSIAVFFIATVLSLFVKLIQIFCPIVNIALIVILGFTIGFALADKIWQ